MLLAIDVGNSHTVIGVFDNDTLKHNWRVKTDQTNTGDELASLFHGLFSMKAMHFTQITGVILASVVPPMQSAWSNFINEHLSCKSLVVDTSIPTGITVLTDNPSEVGADRIVNAAAAYKQFRTALIIVDFGTAITLDCVSKKGEYLGGVIAPGLGISMEALGEKTAKLPRVDISTPPAAAIGTNTVDAIKSGVLFGFGGMVEGLITRIKNQMDKPEPKVIATGGMAALIAPYAPSIESVDPLLTLIGLKLIHGKNS